MKMASLFQRINVLFSVVIVFLSMPAAMANLAAERSALLSLRSAVGGRTIHWNTSDQTPCQWPGVQCNEGTVTALHLPGYSLSGDIPVGIMGKLTGLQTISLRFNYLSGSLPSDLSSCSELRNLYLHGNRFTGELPEFLSSLTRLVRVNLAGNRFSGKIPVGFNNLTRIRTLYLEQNALTGSIPDLVLLNLAQFNVSYNRLNGSIPKRFLSMPATAFTGNSLCGGPLDACSSDAPTSTPATAPSQDNIMNMKKKGLAGGVITAIVVGSILVFIILVLLLFFFYRHEKNEKKTSSIDAAAINQLDKEISGHPVAAVKTTEKKLVFFGNSERVFDLEDLLSASAEVLGKGTFGTAYKAVLDRGYTVAVKRLKDVTLSEVEFIEKVEAVGAMEHQNLVPIRAYYYIREEKLLVYDYMPMGSLSALLHSNIGVGRTPLSWNKRINIALGSARGIEFIHSQIPQVSHGNIKPSNILLTKSNEALVSDFGLNHLVSMPSSPYPTRLTSYRAPEVTEPHRVSQQADVYSFGVLILELVTGKEPTCVVQNEECFFDLPRWVRSIVKEEWRNEVFDSELRNEDVDEEKMVRMLQLGVDCTAQYPDMRPSISEVRQKIEDLQSDRDI